MKNKKGFAITGILYAILVLFLFLILLVLNNFQARKVLFDKQKDTVLEKLGNSYNNVLERDYIYNSEIELQEYITIKDGVYKIEVWGSDVGGYISGNVNLYQGVKLYISIGSTSGTDTSSSIRTEKYNVNTIILKARGSDVTSGTFAYNQVYINENGIIDDISLEPVDDVVILEATSIPKKSSKAGTNGYVKISYIEELSR